MALGMEDDSLLGTDGHGFYEKDTVLWRDGNGLFSIKLY